MLLWVMAFFAVLIAAVGGLAAFFLQHNFESIREVNALTDRSKQVDVINSDMLRARVNLMVAARHLQESGWGSGENSARDAATALKGATDLLTGVRARFADFQKNMLQDDTGRQLSMNLVRRYRSYIDDGVDTMVEALRSEDYSTFYMVNNEYGTPRSAAFIEAIGEFSKYIGDQQQATIEQADANFNRAMIAVGVAVALALILMVLARVLFGRLVVRPLVEAGQHFDKIAAGDLTSRVEVRSHNEIGQLFAALKRMQESLTRTVSTVRRAWTRSRSARARSRRATRTCPAAPRSRRLAGRDRGFDGAAGLDRQAERGQRAPGQSAGGQRVTGRTRRFGGVGSGDDDAGHFGQLAQDLGDRVGDRRHRVPDQHPGAERGGGSGAGGRAGRASRWWRARLAGAAQRAGGQGDQGPDRGLGQQGRRGFAAGGARGATMQEIVASVKRVTDIMGEISAASEEQSSGIDQVNRAVSQMDEVTQQNAALVEEAAAAAGSLQEQAQRLAGGGGGVQDQRRRGHRGAGAPARRPCRPDPGAALRQQQRQRVPASVATGGQRRHVPGPGRAAVVALAGRVMPRMGRNGMSSAGAPGFPGTGK